MKLIIEMTTKLRKLSKVRRSLAITFLLRTKMMTLNLNHRVHLLIQRVKMISLIFIQSSMIKNLRSNKMLWMDCILITKSIITQITIKTAIKHLKFNQLISQRDKKLARQFTLKSKKNHLLNNNRMIPALTMHITHNYYQNFKTSLTLFLFMR